MCEALPYRRIKITWKKIGSCDWVGKDKSGRYVLRAERMDDWYWWCVYVNNEEKDASWYEEYKKPATTAKIAKLRAVKALNKWRRKYA